MSSGKSGVAHPVRAGHLRADRGPPLPYVSAERTLEAVSRLTAAEAEFVLAERIIPLARAPGTIIFAAEGERALMRAREGGLDVRALVSRGALLSALHEGLGRILRKSSVYGLVLRAPHFSALRRLTAGQVGWVIAIGLLAADLYVLGPGLAALLANLVFSVLFLAVIAIRFMSLQPLPRLPVPRPLALADRDLPDYTVLVPLFRETRVAASLLRALDALDYPHDRLDIKLILEADDRPMRRLIARKALPSHYEVIVVPPCRPRTKPKALNFALHFARGELVTVFDAEDIPHPGQLRLAASYFAWAPAELVCLQAALGFYNARENWLTRGIMAQTPVISS